MSRIVICGLGAVSPAGCSIDEIWERINREQTRPVDIGDLVSPETMENRRFYKTPDIDGDDVPPAESAAYRLARRAIADALKDACLDSALQRIGLVVGTGAGEIERFERRGFAGGPEGDCAYGLAARLAGDLGLRGPNLTVSNACSASSYGFVCAEDMLDDDTVDAVVVCGVETLSRTTLASFNRLMALDPDSCRPFAEDRGGTVLGDGAAAIALARRGRVPGPNAYATLAGIGVSCDAHHPTAPRPGGDLIAKALSKALSEAGISPEAIDVIVPHATGTRANDYEEYGMLRRVLGDRLSEVPIFAPKAGIGHGGGASGAFSVLLLALILRHQKVPPTRGTRPASEFAIRMPETEPMPVRARFGLTNAYAFGGNNISLILEALS